MERSSVLSWEKKVCVREFELKLIHAYISSQCKEIVRINITYINLGTEQLW